MAQLVSVKKIETNGGLHSEVSLTHIKMSQGNQQNHVENGATEHKGQNGIGSHVKEPQTKGNGVQNGASYHEKNDSDGTTAVQDGGTSDESPIPLEPADSFCTTKANSSVKITMGDDESTKLVPITVIRMLENTVKVSANRIALGVKREGKWRNWTYSEYYEAVRTAAKSFIKLGLEPYHGVGIIGFNSPEWVISDLGAICAGGLAVGIYTTNSPEACHFVVSDSKCNIVVVENKIQLDKILKVWDRLPHLKAVIQYTGTVEEKRSNVYDWNEFLEAGKDVSEAALQEVINGLKPNKCCTLIYTSGTTGNPKGVMLSHDNMTWTAKMACEHVHAGQKGEEHVVSYLPLSHIAAQQTDIMMPMYCKGTLWFAQPDALKGSLVTTLKETRPTLILGVPRVWEKMMEKLLDVGSNVTGLKRKIANWAKGVALQGNQNIEEGKSVPFGWGLAISLLKKIKVALGLDRCRLQFVGAAPVTLETLQYFQSINIPLYELYGMSECSGPHTVSIPGHIISGSCGIPLPGCQQKILNPDEDGCGELCLKGRHVFMGYLNNEEKTKESLDDEGWLHSGDVAKIDKNQQLYITGRIKELIITAGGENVAPVVLEDNIKKELPLIISNVMVIGDKRKFLSCLLTLKVDVDPDTGEPSDNLNKSALDFCKSIGSEAKTVSEVLSTKDEKIMKAIQEGVNRANEQAPSRAQKIQKWQILEKDFSIPGGELGPTLKLRRPIVAKMHKDLIDGFYHN